MLEHPPKKIRINLRDNYYDWTSFYLFSGKREGFLKENALSMEREKRSSPQINLPLPQVIPKSLRVKEMDYSELSMKDPQKIETLPTSFLEHVKLTIDQLSREMEQTCDNCCGDRLSCSFSPLCDHRWWLDLLIESGISKKLFPQFCYERRGKEIERFMKRKGTLVKVEDARFLLNDFLKLLGLKKQLKGEKLPQEDVINSVVKFHRKFWNEVRSIRLDEKVFLLLNGFEVINQIDFSKKVVRVNLKKGKIRSKDTLVSLLEQGMKMLNLPHHTFQTPYALYLRVELHDLSTEVASDLSTKAKSFVPFSQVIDGNPSLVLGLTTNPEEPNLTFETLKSVFSLLSGAIRKKEEKNREK